MSDPARPTAAPGGGRGTISVVIPALNAARYLPEAIASVQAQTRAVAEVIVIDDCSTDDSVEVARSFGATCLSTATNSGPSAARNLGLRAAQGDLIAFLDADDYWDPTHCETTAGLLDAHPETTVAFGLARTLGSTAISPAAQAPVPQGVPGDVFWPLLERNFITQSGVVARREALLAVGGYDESMRHSEDYDLWLRLSRRVPFACTHVVTVNYRLHDDQVSLAPLAMARGWWRARRHVYHAIVADEGASSPAAAKVSAVLANAWAADLEWAWRSADRPLLEAALDQHDVVPGSAKLHALWRRRFRRFWPLWVSLVKLWELVPQPARDWLKRTTRRGSALRV